MSGIVIHAPQPPDPQSQYLQAGNNLFYHQLYGGVFFTINSLIVLHSAFITMDDPASIQKFLAAMSRGPNLQTNKYTSHTTEPQNSSNEVAEEKSIVTQPSKESSVTEPSKADPHNNVMGGKHSPALTEDAVAPVAEVPKDKTTVPEAPNAKAGDNDTENTTHTKSSSVEPLKEVTAINKPEAKTSPKAGHVDWYKDLKDRMDVIRKSQGPMDPRLTQNYSPIPPEYEERCIVARDTIQKVLESYSPRSSRPSSSHGSQGQGSVIQGFTRTRTFASKTPSPKNTRGPSEQSRMAGTKDSRAGSPLSQRGDNWVAPHLRNLKKDHRAEDTTKVAPEQSANVETNTPNQEKTWFPRHLPSPDHSDRGDSRSRPTTEETSPSPLQLSQEKPESAQDDGPASHSPTMTPCPQSLKHSSPAKDESNEPPSKEVPTVPAPESIEAQKSTQQAVASIVVTPKAVGEHVDREGVLYFKSWGAPQQRERAGNYPFLPFLPLSIHH